MPEPKPKPADEAQAANEQSEEALREATEDAMDELTEATERAAEDAQTDDSDTSDSPFSGTEDTSDVDLDLADVDVGEPASSGSPFAGTDDSSSTSTSSSDGPRGGEQAEGEFDPDEFFEDTSEELDALKTSINEGAARLAVVGLDEDEHDKDGLEDEFTEVFTAFRLGHFGAHTADEYILSGDDDIDPVWGLLGAMLLCSTVVMVRRPDSDEITDSIKMKMNDARKQVQ
jgi:hypothetical protein